MTPPRDNRLSHVQWVRGRRPGQWYAYYRVRTHALDLAIRLKGAPGSAAFARSYAAAKARAEGLAPSLPAPGTLKDIIRIYRSRPEYQRLADSTRASYNRDLHFFEKEFSDAAIGQVTRSFAFALQSRMKDTPRAADKRLVVLSILCQLAVDMEMIERNPLAGMKKLRRKRDTTPFAPWTAEEIKRVCDCSPVYVAFAIRLAAATGLRHGDLRRLSWTHYRDGFIEIVTRKQNQPVIIPLQKDIRHEIEGRERTAMTILTTPRGQSWGETGLSAIVSQWAHRAGLIGKTLHGLRKTAICNLAEAGATIPQIQAITGQSFQTVAYYYEGANRRRLAQGAVHKLVKHR